MLNSPRTILLSLVESISRDAKAGCSDAESV